MASGPPTVLRLLARRRRLVALSAAAVSGLPSVSPHATLLVGYGSIGRLHARALARMAPRLVIVDASAEARAAAGTDYPEAHVTPSLDALPGDSLPWAATLAVIATWGPSHHEIFDALVDRGVRRILCEKPIATSVVAIETILARARREGVSLGSHHYFRASGLVAALEKLADELALGAPVAIVTNGGAACIVTNGLHWVDLAAALFHAAPRRVVAQLRDDPINPRAKPLSFIGGTASWDYGGGRELVLHFNNASSVYPMTHVQYRDAVVTLDYDYEVVVHRRDPADVARFPAVTRMGPTRHIAFKGQLPGVVDGITALTTH